MGKKRKWQGGPIGYATFGCKVEKEPPSLKLKYNFPVGKGISTDSNSSLIRPFNNILNEGRKPGKITFVFLRDGLDYYVLGSFSFTGKYLIFFPGLKDRRISNFGPKEYLSEGTTLNINHFTLEKSFAKWHVTTDEKKENGIKFPNQKTKKIDENNWLWFVFKIAGSNKLERCPQEIRIQLFASLNEINRRLPIIIDSREEAIFQITELDKKERRPFFWYVEFFASKSKLREDRPENMITVMKNNATKLIDFNKRSLTRIHQIFLKDFDGSIFIRVSKVRGEISKPLIFETGANIIPPKSSK